MNTRQIAEKRGRLAELVALNFLRLKGYHVLAQRFKAPHGEIDLIMRRGKTTVFVEVKARKSVDDAVISVSPHQARRIVAAAELWLGRDQRSRQGFTRFDIVAITSYFWPTHIANAFTGDR
jgi:putative endonuclease